MDLSQPATPASVFERSRVLVRLAGAAALLAGVGTAQSFQNTPSQVPSGGTFNSGFTENIDFSDIDGDGDRDAVKADGGDFGNQQSRLWVNRGFEAGGTIGFFADRTAAQFPAVPQSSRDMDFVDIDLDGDDDLYISNTSAESLQSNRWWINMGGVQGGTAGFFQDQTSTRWTFIGVNNGTTHLSSVAPSVVQAGGGFTDWSCDCVFGDLDNDGDDDLFHSTYGGGGDFDGVAPSRIFLNNGLGFFEEFNPSGFQLSGTALNNGSPGLWCQGNQLHGTANNTGTSCDISDTPLGVELGDLDGDLDIDVLQGSRNTTPRLYKSRMTDTGVFSFRDVTSTAGFSGNVSGANNYEQELGDFDNDDDLDMYGLNWPGFVDITMKNNGTGSFSLATTLANSDIDDNEPDWFDYNNDGRLDAYCSAFTYQNRLYRNNGPASYSHTDVTGSELPAIVEDSLGSDTCDIDNDGDYDVLVGNDLNDPERLYKNVNQIADAIAPRVNHLEQAPNRVASCSAGNTVIRVHIYDNASWDVTRYDTVNLLHSTDGVNFTPSPMLYAGGQIFRGEIPCNLVGTVSYKVQATDEHGNLGTSVTLSYVATCPSGATTYCTAGTSSSGCLPVISGSGTASATAASGFVLSVTNVEGAKQGLFFYGVTGRKALPWAPGNSSYLCVQAPTQRLAPQTSTGTAGTCTGTFTDDWNAYRAAHPTAVGQPFAAGICVDVQAWYRDPSAPGTTNLTGGLEFVVCN